MSQGGRALVSSSGGWPHLSFVLQGSSKLGSCLEQIYNYYLAPLEDHLPKGIRPARARQWMEQYAQQHAETFSPKEKSKADEIVTNARKRMRPLGCGEDAMLSLKSVEQRACKIVRAMALDVMSTVVPMFAQESFLEDTDEETSSKASDESMKPSCSEEAAQSDTEINEGERRAMVGKEQDAVVSGSLAPLLLLETC